MADMTRGAYLRMLSAVYAAMFLIRVAFGITIVTFAEYLPAGDFVYSLVVSSSPLLELITVAFAGVVIDRFGRRGVLLTGLGLGAISLYGLALTQNVILLTLVNALHGVSAALILVTTLAVIATFAPPERRGREMGSFNLANITGWIGGFMVGFLLLEAFEENLAYTFVLAGALATFGLLYANRMLVLPDDGPRRHGRAPDIKDLLASVGNRRIMLLTLPWLIVFMLVGAFITFLPRIATSALDISGGTTALGILGVGLILMTSQYFWGRLADKHGHAIIMLVGGIGFTLLMAVIMFAYFETDSTDSRVIFEDVMAHWVLLSLTLFTALAFAPAGLAAIADEAKEGAQGTTMSAYSLTLSLGFILGPPALGFVSETFGGTGMVLYFAALALGLLGLVTTAYFMTRGGSAEATPAEALVRGPP